MPNFCSARSHPSQSKAHLAVGIPGELNVGRGHRLETRQVDGRLVPFEGKAAGEPLPVNLCEAQNPELQQVIRKSRSLPAESPSLAYVRSSVPRRILWRQCSPGGKLHEMRMQICSDCRPFW